MTKQALGKSIMNKFFDKSFFEIEIGGHPRKVITWKIIRAIIYNISYVQVFNRNICQFRHYLKKTSTVGKVFITITISGVVKMCSLKFYKAL